MILPTLAGLALVIGYPVVRTFLLSHLHYNLISPAPARAVGAANYGHLWHDPIFWQALKNTAVYTLGSVVIAMAIGAGLALLTENFSGPWRHLKTLLLTPWAVPFIVVAFLFRYMFEQRGGVVNALLFKSQLIDTHLAWLNSAERAMPAVMTANIWTQIPFFFLIFSAALAGIPRQILESARMDRARGWAMIWYIKVPFMRGAALVAGLLMVISNFNDFAKIWAMTQGGPGYATTTLVVYVYRLAFTSYDFGYSAAIGVVWLVLLIIFAVLYIRLMQRGAR
jgi:ABC-type sugar transport system permease subunit